VGTRTDAALAQVVAARADFANEVDRLEAAGRAAVDIPAKVRQEPVKAAGVAAGAAFLALGGPKRLFRRARRAVTGKEEELPSELLPKEVEKALRKLGGDGKKVRGTLEREFANYLDDRAKERKKEGILAAIVALGTTALRPVAMKTGRQLVERMLDPNGRSFQEQMQKIRERRATGDDAGADSDGGPRSGAGL
jgi:hypothetical protein